MQKYTKRKLQMPHRVFECFNRYDKYIKIKAIFEPWDNCTS